MAEANTAKKPTGETATLTVGGKTLEFPEVDRAAWFPMSQARTKLLKGQVAFINRLARKLGVTIENNGVTSAPGQP